MIRKDITRKERLIYLGGLWDGEGSAGVYSVHRWHYLDGRRERPYRTIVPLVQIRMTDPEPVAAVSDFFRLGWHGKSGPLKSGKIVYEWRATNRIAAGVAAMLVPYVKCGRVKDKLVKVAEFYDPK